jgi:hypothetical protein
MTHRRVMTADSMDERSRRPWSPPVRAFIHHDPVTRALGGHLSADKTAQVGLLVRRVTLPELVQRPSYLRDPRGLGPRRPHDECGNAASLTSGSQGERFPGSLPTAGLRWLAPSSAGWSGCPRSAVDTNG